MIDALPTLHPDIEKVLFTREQIRDRVRELAGAISREHDGTPVHLVAVLRGDVNGSWAGGGADLDNTDPTYFQLLAVRLGVPDDVWGM